jgi:hypothetical protein
MDDQHRWGRACHAANRTQFGKQTRCGDPAEESHDLILGIVRRVSEVARAGGEGGGAERKGIVQSGQSCEVGSCRESPNSETRGIATKLTRTPVAMAAKTWVRYGAMAIKLEVEIVAWTPRAMAIHWKAPSGDIHKAWVWASAIERPLEFLLAQSMTKNL